ncbi:MAG: histidine kinase [Wenzhouxiangella sp.]|nr:histidine kinase [Wenzhouxiangella sp.]
MSPAHGWLAYRQFPVFSWAWLWRRTLLFGLFVLLWGMLASLMTLAGGGTPEDAFGQLGYFLVGMLGIVAAGPCLAMLVRHWTLPGRRQRFMVVAAIAIGMLLAYLVDAWSSGHLSQIDAAADTGTTALGPVALTINVLVLILIYGILGGAVALRAYLLEDQRLKDHYQGLALARLEREKLEADRQLALLQAQVEPHFLFNTLATVRASLRSEPDHAEATLDALCDYLRATIPRMRRQGAVPSTLCEQLDLCARFLSVMDKRMRERLAWSIEADDQVRTQPFPPLLLLSLVENAIRHGLEPKPEGGHITISAGLDSDRLWVDVADNGCGLPDAPGSGVGLDNIRQQLKLRYGDQARLALESPPSGGVRARIELSAEPDGRPGLTDREDAKSAKQGC